MARYASTTLVSVERSRAEIERVLERFGADCFGYEKRRMEIIIRFTYRRVTVQMSMPVLPQDDQQFIYTPRDRKRSKAGALVEWQREVRRRWRSLCLVIKALVVGVEDGVLRFEEAFLPYIVWGSGLTTAEMLLPAVEKALEAGAGMPNNLKQLPAPAPGDADAHPNPA